MSISLFVSTIWTGWGSVLFLAGKNWLSEHDYEWFAIRAEAGGGTSFRFIRFGTSMGRTDFFVVFLTSQ